MTYLCITPYFPSATSVIGPFIYDQVRAIERTGSFERVLVLKPCPWYCLRLEYEYDGITVHLFRSFQLPSKILPDVFNSLNAFFFFRRLKQVGITCKTVTVAHLHTSPLAKYGAWLKRRCADCRIWVQHHDLDPLLIRMGCLRSFRWHQRLAVRKRLAYLGEMDIQICVSDIGLRQLQAFPASVLTSFPHYLGLLKLYQDFPQVRIKEAYVLRNGADPRKFYPARQSATNKREDEEASRERPFRIGCVAAFNEWKGQLTLIQAAEMLLKRATEKRPGAAGDLEVILIGQGPGLAACRAYVSEHQLERQIRFESLRDHRALLAFYQSLDLFVLPSFFETFACVYLEAYACGVPFICCKGQGNAESIPAQDAERWTIEPGDYQGLAARIEAFREKRYPQTLTHAVDIDVLVRAFLAEKAGVRSGMECGDLAPL